MYRMVLIPDSGSVSVDVINFMKKKFRCNDVGIYLKFKSGGELNFPEIQGLLLEVTRKQIKEYSEVPGDLMNNLCKTLSNYNLPSDLAENISFVSKNTCDYYYGFFPINENTLNTFKGLVYDHNRRWVIWNIK